MKQPKQIANVKTVKGLKVKTHVRAGATMGFEDRDTFGSEYGKF